ncbi:MAG: TrmH family RNA methyltransferase [Gammaproteobacteria bacterium]|nr:TrmH family RNA methyltransferase [Gammaproteobacteria bacterium]
MVSRQERKIRIQRQRQALLRYQKERFKNAQAVPGQNDFIMVLDHLKAGFNVPKIFRTAEAFGAREVHMINIAPFDPSPSKGAFRKVPAIDHDTFRGCYQNLSDQGYTLFCLDAGCEHDIYDVSLPAKSAFVMGNEGLGHSFDRNEYPEVQCLRIPHAGMMESLNVSVAASIVMYEYMRQHHTDGPKADSQG